jgi:uncharacterized protein (TIGR04222 family)
MNPLDLPGPAFLVFYVILCAVVTVAARLVVAALESRRPSSLALDDPYQIAWLRGGAPEAARIAVLSLVDRGVLEVNKDKKLARRSASPWDAPRQPLERAVYDLAANPADAGALFKDRAVSEVCAGYRERLAKAGLVPDADGEGNRLLILAVALAIVLGIAVLKAGVALSRGKENLAFLAVLAVVAAVVLWKQILRRRTRAGDTALGDLRRLFDALKGRAASIQAGRMTNDAMLLAAVFGLSALPGTGFATLHSFFPKASSSSGGSCGSSCGSGGCGGGGGCGGCGS